MLTRFPAEELLVTGKMYVRGVDLLEGKVVVTDDVGGNGGGARAPDAVETRSQAVSRADSAAGQDVDFHVGLYRRMLLIRRFEELVQSLFLRGEIYGTTHLCSGQEAVSVGFASALDERDRVACTYRGHGHMLARGCPPEALLAELLGRTTGVNGGRAGSMNMIDLDHGTSAASGSSAAASPPPPAPRSA